METNNKTTTILLGHGIFSIGAKPIALTRGGGKFSVEREYREIEADGYPGPIKGNIVVDKSTAKLEINQLTVVPEDFKTYYPALNVDAATPGTVKIEGNSTIKDSDYQDEVSWTGKTREGKAVKIIVKNAINLESIDWEMQDKSEVINKLTYNACFIEGELEKEPWEINWGVATA
ncbi:MAG TPA: hypothetical protein DDY58_20365 [Terrisporobacter glycolicus]|uniref:hypothetical protein n=1 Tax=Terrisporobacter TaxID=1505652 RepID=UPI000E8507DF|nr:MULTISPECIES: hypothetical protein [Terrisporobacter]HBI94585.1 hypothetical protein [Terrisporobacter hibernicus]